MTDISIVIPLYNEEESLPELADWIERVCSEHGYSYEVIMVDDGSTDNSWKTVQELSQQNSAVKGIKFQRNYGKSAALNEGAPIRSAKPIDDSLILSNMPGSIYLI